MKEIWGWQMMRGIYISFISPKISPKNNFFFEKPKKNSHFLNGFGILD
jgi:hypothetical protein